VGAGLFTYPSLMAADVLLYQANLVPVGEDQKQHLELTRDLAQRFNQRFGHLFEIPEPYIPEIGARIMSLEDASKKMSKSNPNQASYIAILDPPDVIRKKISRAVTDSGKEIKFDSLNKPEISNLMSIYAHCANMTLGEIENKYADAGGYGQFKKDLAEQVVTTLEPIQQRYHEIRSTGEIHDILRQGADRAAEVANDTLEKVKDMMGFLASR
ncbi:MAG: tryptophan--tRNA ligase, partial [Paenibacillus sp. RIFOXYA1_FULL_44_5]